MLLIVSVARTDMWGYMWGKYYKIAHSCLWSARLQGWVRWQNREYHSYPDMAQHIAQHEDILKLLLKNNIFPGSLLVSPCLSWWFSVTWSGILIAQKDVITYYFTTLPFNLPNVVSCWSLPLPLSLSRPETGRPGRQEIAPRSGRLEEEEKERVELWLTGWLGKVGWTQLSGYRIS